MVKRRRSGERYNQEEREERRRKRQIEERVEEEWAMENIIADPHRVRRRRKV